MMRKLLLGLAGALLLSFASHAQLQHGRVVPIDSIQYVNPQDLSLGKDKPSYHFGDTVTLVGRVMSDPRYAALSSSFRYFWLQDTTQPWHGVQIIINPGSTPGYNLQQLKDAINYDNIVPGLLIKLTGVVAEFSNNTQVNILPVETEIMSLTPKTFSPVKVTIDMFRKIDSTNTLKDQFSTGEPYEGMYVQINDVTVVDVIDSKNGRFYWKIQDSKGNKMSIRDASAFFRNDNLGDSTPSTAFAPPGEGSNIEYLRGFIFHYQEGGQPSYFIAPFRRSDVGPIKASPPQIKWVKRNPIVAASSDKVTISADIEDDREGVKSAVLYYAVNNGSVSSLTMSGSGNIYQADIPAQANKSIVNYWIQATDTSGNTQFYPDSLKKGWHYMVFNGGISSIADIQTPYSAGHSAWEGDTLKNISVGGIVTSTTAQNDLGLITIQGSHVAPYSGIFLGSKMNMPLDSIKRGDSVLITQAVVRENETYKTTNFTSNTFLDNITIQVVSHNNTIPAPVKNLSTDSFLHGGGGAYAEMYEAMMLEFKNVFVVQQNADSASGNNYGEWNMSTDSTKTAGIRADDFSNDIPATFNIDSLDKGQKLAYIRGILTYNYGDWKIMPRNRDDIAGFHTPVMNGIKDNQFHAFRIYPNPASEAVYIDMQKSDGAVKIQLIDISGKVMQEQVSDQGLIRVPVENLPSGIYILRLSDRKSASQEKIIIYR